jgi:TolA-binding protein
VAIRNTIKHARTWPLILSAAVAVGLSACTISDGGETAGSLPDVGLDADAGAGGTGGSGAPGGAGGDIGAGGAGGSAMPDPTAPDEVAFQAALALYDAQQYPEAQAALEGFLAEYPNSVRADNATYLVARCQFELADFAGAKAGFTAFLAGFPDSSLVDDAQYYLPRCDYELGDFQAAVQGFTRFVAAYPDSTLVDNARYYLARSFFSLDDFAGTLSACAPVLDLADSGQRDACLYWSGRAADALGELEGPTSARFAEAEGYFDRLFADYPEGAYEDNGRYYHGMVAYHREDYFVAQMRLDVMRAQFPMSLYADNATYFSARCVYHLDDFLGAAAAFEAFLAAFPESDYLDDGTYYLGRSHYEAGRVSGDPTEYQAAIVAFDVVTTDHADGLYGDNAWYYKLRAHIALGDCASAQADADALAAGFPDSTYNAQAQTHLANDC